MSLKPCCVVIDDDLAYLDRLKRFFIASCLDYEVVSFSNAVDAIDYVRHRRVDLILTAYLVPYMDGLQFISLVRSFNAHIPILMMSSVPIEACALARGATAFLAKSRLWTQLSSILRTLGNPLVPTPVET